MIQAGQITWSPKAIAGTRPGQVHFWFVPSSRQYCRQLRWPLGGQGCGQSDRGRGITEIEWPHVNKGLQGQCDTQVLDGKPRRNFDQQLNRKKGRLEGLRLACHLSIRVLKTPRR